ncbi:hypothetical protein P691DRAFT_684341 [Macrolepiota fuliginosa MF-IS2]|uniref:Uncharacterized protein n=1 Tax=Macrolepiota fuliginosa MF-IS2 TaxID=1400762 RepID=A0A9P5X0V1_9AGAR|nr:hypothetical protein P691DRAFT_684341 [Macrolepiota fuliginosa MF-IS2]
MYMSNHPDTPVAYVKWYGKVQETITCTEMSAIDTKVCACCLDFCTPSPGCERKVAAVQQKGGLRPSVWELW